MGGAEAQAGKCQRLVAPQALGRRSVGGGEGEKWSSAAPQEIPASTVQAIAARVLIEVLT